MFSFFFFFFQFLFFKVLLPFGLMRIKCVFFIFFPGVFSPGESALQNIGTALILYRIHIQTN